MLSMIGFMLFFDARKIKGQNLLMLEGTRRCNFTRQRQEIIVNAAILNRFYIK